MKALSLPKGLGCVVCLGAHPDDIEIGAGATIAALRLQNPSTFFQFIVMAGSPIRADEARSSVKALLGAQGDIVIGEFTDGFVPYESPGDVKRFVRSALPTSDVDLVIAPQTTDRHQDHRFVGELAGQLFRDQMILGYEIVKYDGGLAAPNLYVPLTSEQAHGKVAHLGEFFPSQAPHHWFREDAFLGLMRIRGIESNADSGYAEAFVTAKVVVQP